MKKITRRTFNTTLSMGVGALATLPKVAARQPIVEKKLGIALVGLGSYSQYQLAPALQETVYCELTGIVTGSPEKENMWRQLYDIPKTNVYNYDNFDSIADNPAIDIVYVVLPNSMHADFSIRAAKAGKHVICEKPMAMNVKECDAIIAACKKANVKLSVGYRLHSEPYTQEVQRIVKEQDFGKPLFVSADAAYISRGNPDQWRLNRKLSGGGALVNMGVYSIQSAIYGTGMNPISVTAQEFSTRPDYFKDTDETISAQLEFPNGVVGNIFTSHNASINRMYVSFEKGWLELQPANNYGPLDGQTSKGPMPNFPQDRKQMGLQMDDFAKHILEGTPNLVPGEMGKRDMIIVEAIYESIKKGGK
ncbi:MAG: Gfo/Idh/MocA family oxidoreductase, partial [Bacteroidota bacterium]